VHPQAQRIHALEEELLEQSRRSAREIAALRMRVFEMENGIAKDGLTTSPISALPPDPVGAGGPDTDGDGDVDGGDAMSSYSYHHHRVDSYQQHQRVERLVEPDSPVRTAMATQTRTFPQPRPPCPNQGHPGGAAKHGGREFGVTNPLTGIISNETLEGPVGGRGKGVMRRTEVPIMEPPTATAAGDVRPPWDASRGKGFKDYQDTVTEMLRARGQM
jgi:hypothetical protein